MKKKYWFLIGLVVITIIIVVWHVNSNVGVTADNELPSSSYAAYSGKVAGVSDYGKIMVYRSTSDKDGFPVSVDDKGNYGFELERHHYPMIEYFSFDTYNKTIPFITKSGLKVSMDFEFYDTLIDGNLVKDCRVTYTGDYKDVFDYLNYHGFNKEIAEPIFEKFSRMKAPTFSDYYNEIENGKQLYIKKIKHCKDASLHSVLVSMLEKDVNQALRKFALLSETPDSDYEEWVKTNDNK